VTWTTIGNLDSDQRGRVGAAGEVTLAGRRWRLDWWIGAEDRWRVPSQEATVRQALVSGSPVVETRVRIPAGDAVHHAYATRGPSGQDAVVVEVRNDSAVPVAVALAVAPHDPDGRVANVELRDTCLLVDGAPVMWLSRAPGRVALAPDDASGAPVVAMLLFPVAHRTSLRVALALGAAEPVDPAALPAAQHVAAGWAALGRQGARVEVPDRRLAEALTASARHLLLGGEGPRAILALDHLGFADEAWERLERAELDREPGATLAALSRHWVLTRDDDAARAAVSAVAELVPALADTDSGDRVRGQAALPDVAALLDAVGETRAARDVRSTIDVLGGQPSTGPPGSAVAELLASASPTWTWATERSGHDVTVNAAVVDGVRAHLVRDDGTGLALCPDVPERWLGQAWEVHDLPTAAGLLSYAVRWHGERPALLWELRAHAGGAPVRLSAPGLDPGWSSEVASGEALLSPTSRARRPGADGGGRPP
jgi:hypothetical protein